jgi:hypothetical protein
MFVFLDSRTSGLIKSCWFSEDMSAYKMLWFHVDWCKFCIHPSSLKIPPLPYSKGPSKKTIIQIKLVGMSMIFHCTNFRLFQCNGSWGIAIKQNIHFKFQPPSMFVFFVFRKSGLIKSCSSSEDLSKQKISRSYVYWYKFCIHLRSLNVHHFGMVTAMTLKLWCQGHLQWHNLPTEFHKNLPIGSQVDGRDKHTDRMVISLAYIFPLGREVG